MKHFLGIFFLLLAWTAQAQRTVTISGMVVDSARLVALPNAFIKVKSTGAGTMAGAGGSFKINAPVFDTLIFSCIGYQTVAYPVLLSEEDVLIRLQESVIILPEVTTIGTRLQETKYEERRAIKTPNENLFEGLGSPFTYFSKTEKEKRKVIKIRQENSRARTYVEVVNDPDLKKELMNEFSIDEPTYYKLLSKFNQENRSVQYLVDETQIREKLTLYFSEQLSHGNRR
jgi:hypothetical protein